jgi:hypothetical protein
MGTPPQRFQLHLDTSSADIWAPATDCTSCGPGHPRLGASTSSSFVAQESKSWLTTYSSSILFSAQSGGSPHLSGARTCRMDCTALTNVSGYGCQDRLSVAGLPLEGFSFGVATQTQNEVRGASNTSSRAFLTSAVCGRLVVRRSALQLHRIHRAVDPSMAFWAAQIASHSRRCLCRCDPLLVLASAAAESVAQGIKSPVVQLLEAGVISRGVLAISIGRAASPGACSRD